ncbi:MAG: right-handed parallel beta-helix repeat-containing protein [Rubripirellula sp.]
MNYSMLSHRHSKSANRRQPRKLVCEQLVARQLLAADIGGSEPTAALGVLPIVVTTTADSGPGSLREAIMTANASAGDDAIHFDIPGPAPYVIEILTALPAITDFVEIDGTTEPDFAVDPVVVLDGFFVSGANTDGLRVTNGGVNITSLTIEDFTGDGIELVDVSNSTIANSQIGYNGRDGVRLTNAPNNLIFENSIYENTGTGIQLAGTGSSLNQIVGNQVGIGDIGGVDVAMGNGNHGIQIGGASNEISYNVVSGNDKFGIAITATDATGNVLLGNAVGTNQNMNAAIPNGNHGVLIRTANNTIGGPGIFDGNVISGNGRSGLVLSGAAATNNTIIGNKIGTSSSGDEPVPNESFGILLSGSSGNYIGGTDIGERNTISGNDRSGLVLSNNSSLNQIVNNAIGVDTNGEFESPNGGNGVFVLGGSSDNLFLNNVIGSNASSQVSIVNGTSTGNDFIGNLIGVREDLSGTLSGGGANGFFIKAPDNHLENNVVAGASSTAIHLSTTVATGNTLTDNFIGTATDTFDDNFGVPIGVQFSVGASGNTLGPGNSIGYSTADAVRSASGGEANTITQNSMAGNAFGIDLGGNGVTANDGNNVANNATDDADSGPNRLQNFPTSLSVTITPISLVEAEVSIVYFVDSNPANSSYPLTVEFFVSDPVVAQGTIYVASDSYLATDYANGSATFTTVVDIADIPASAAYGTATATDAAGNTSEFTSPPVAISLGGFAVAQQSNSMASINYDPMDVSRDGEVTSADLLFVLNELAELGALGEATSRSSANNLDVNKDGNVTLSDALDIINRLAHQHAQSIAMIDNALDDLEEELIADLLVEGLLF